MVLISTLLGCGTTKGPETRSVDEVYRSAITYFNDEDYKDATRLFDLITLQYSVSQYADDAQFYLGEISYKKGEFIMASYKYNLLRRVYPSSEFAKECLYKSSMCYYELSPTFDRDQEYSKKAIEAFQEFQSIYPDDSLYHAASKRIMDLRNKLAEREYFTATLYMKMESPNSAVVYYDYVIDKFNDTDFLEPAFYGKIEALFIMKKLEQIKSLIPVYKQKFPTGANLSKINDIAGKLK